MCTAPKGTPDTMHQTKDMPDTAQAYVPDAAQAYAGGLHHPTQPGELGDAVASPEVKSVLTYPTRDKTERAMAKE